ncbi:WAT1-related protein [Glycine soja]|nr:WAT1-related protein [Glycine soja]
MLLLLDAGNPCLGRVQWFGEMVEDGLDAGVPEAQPGSFKIVNKCCYRITLGRHTPPDSLFRAANRRPLISAMHINKRKHKQFQSLLTHVVVFTRERRNNKNKMRTWFRNAKLYLLLLAVQFGSAGMFVFAMDAIKKGMSHYVFTVYRNVIASVTLAPFAFVLERKVRPKMTVRIFAEIMALAFFEIILDQCFALLGMKFTSASFLSAVMNSAPSVTFLLAVILK